MDLKTRFNQLCTKYRASQNQVEDFFDKIVVEYSKPYKTYHNLYHLQALFSFFDIYQGKLKYPNEVAFAIFYHDIVYSISTNNNEEKSAQAAAFVLSKMNIDTSIVNRVTDLILATKYHVANSSDEKWMIDFDLSILGQTPDIYKSYTQKIRQEYRKIPMLMYKKGRKKVLQHFLDKDYIFQTDIFRSKYEDIARNNLKTELNILKNGSK